MLLGSDAETENNALIYNFCRLESPCQLVPIDSSNIDMLQELNTLIFPVRYSAEFYTSVLNLYGKELSRICVHKQRFAGAICCRRESLHSGMVITNRDQPCYVYMMTLGVLPEFRRQKLASHLLESIFSTCIKDSNIICVRLHVHVNNFAAIKFYQRSGFAIISLVKDYYLRNEDISPADAYLLEKSCI